MESETFAPSPVPTDASDDANLFRELGGCACAIIFLLLVLIDAWKATRRKAYWFPGGVLVLSALTIQLINYLDYSNSEGNGRNVSLDTELVIDSERVAICVFVAYLLPGMVSSGFREVLSNIVALALSVLAHVLSDYFSVDFEYIHSQASKTELKSFEVFSTILSTSLILLVLLCICAVFAGKTIRNIIDQKVPVVLSCCSKHSPPECNNIEEHVLKCWIVVRSCQPDYIIARSVLSALAGLVVTVCVASIIVKWGYIDKNLTRLKNPFFIMNFLFILVGWIVVSIRWWTAVILFPTDGLCWLQIEDFWKRSVIEWKDSLDEHLNDRLFLKKRNCKIVNLMIALRLHYLLLAIGVCLQIVMVLLSKASWFISRMVLCCLLCCSVKRHEKNPPAKYKEVLEIIRMPGERAYSLWIANESAFKKTEKNIQQGKTKSSKKELMKLMKIGSAADEAAGTLMGKENRYFKYVGKKSSKMRAVSLIRFMLCLYDGTNFEMVDDAIKACSQAWDLMDFVHISDPEANLVSRAADKEFCTLHNIWKKHLHRKPAGSKAVRKIRKRLQKDKDSRLSNKESRITVDNMHDSMNWMTAAVNISLYKTGEAIGSSDTVDHIRCLLANVFVNCLRNELKKELVENCSNWAQQGMEKEIYHAAFIAGKATLLLDTIGGGNDAVPKAVAQIMEAIVEVEEESKERPLLF